MIWDLTMFLTHAFAFLALVAIFPHAPGVLQKIFLGIAGTGFMWGAICYAAILAGARIQPEIVHLGYIAGHIACMLSVLRIFLVDQERRCLRNSYPRSQQ
jgi:hypothetical protein